MDKLKLVASKVLSNYSEELAVIGDEIWKNPELNYEEYKAHNVLTSFLKSKGFSVERSYTGLETAFRAEFGTGTGKPKLGLLCEYDALPEIGHGCGHNLIAESSVAVAIALKEALESSKDKIDGTVVVLGTPGEEGGGGKILLMRNKAFEDLDMVMMAHPSSVSIVRPLFDAVKELKVVYKSKEVAMGVPPWDRGNSCDAAVMGYNAVSMRRQQFKPSWQVQMVLPSKASDNGIIPEESIISCYVKAPNVSELQVLEDLVCECFRSAGPATGCTVSISQLNYTHENIRHNAVLGRLFTSNCGKLKMTGFADQMSTYGSTDMIRVSKIVPTLYVYYKIGDGPVNHSKEFTAICNKPESHLQTLLVAKVLAHTALEAMGSAELQQQVLEEFSNEKT